MVYSKSMVKINGRRSKPEGKNQYRQRLTAALLSLALAALFGACAGSADRLQTPTPEIAIMTVEAGPGSSADPATSALAEVRQQIVDGGLSLVGKEKLVVNGKSYSFDCTGVVLASYAFAEIDLAFRFNRYSGNGVRRIFYTLHDEDLLYRVDYPIPGDIIFWDNTYDANRNGKVDDEFTHVGLVIAVADDGLISYLHHHYRQGAIVEYMNLLEPDKDFDNAGRRINSALRMRGLGGDIGTNAAQLFRIFGQGWKLPLLPN